LNAVTASVPSPVKFPGSVISAHQPVTCGAGAGVGATDDSNHDVIYPVSDGVRVVDVIPEVNIRGRLRHSARVDSRN
jgi:hypothetical protein